MLIVMGILIALQTFYEVKNYLDKVANQKKVHNIVNHRIPQSEEELQEQLDQVLDCIETMSLTDRDKGLLYERASMIYRAQSEMITYYRYTGYALYYLEQSGEKDDTVKLYMDLANSYIDNFSFERAEEMITHAMQVEQFDEIADSQIKSLAYRMQGMMHFYRKEYNLSEQALEKSLELINRSYNDLYENTDRLMTEVALARVYAVTGRYEKAADIVDAYKESSLVARPIYHDALMKDLILPYYEVKCYIALANATDLNDEAARAEINKYIILCERESCEKQELNSLLMMEKQFRAQGKEITKEFQATIQKLYVRLFDAQNEDYARLIAGQVDDSKLVMEHQEKYKQENSTRVIYMIASALLIAILIVIFIIIIGNSQTDGLTKLRARKVFDHDLERAKRTLNTYGIVMMDIDNFKSVNDTYGHPAGDRVLVRLGKILRKFAKGQVRAYRYGGEEFVLLVSKDALGTVDEIAERIRKLFEAQIWDFQDGLTITLSMGIAKGEGRDDVVKRADDHLYHSKKNGKNRITKD